MKPVSFHPDAAVEADSAAAYYYAGDPMVAGDFFAVWKEQSPRSKKLRIVGAGKARPLLQRRRLQKFPFILFYLNDSDKIIVLAVAHTSRRPGYWKERISVD